MTDFYKIKKIFYKRYEEAKWIISKTPLGNYEDLVFVQPHSYNLDLFFVKQITMAEIINDEEQNIYFFYKFVQNHPIDFMHALRDCKSMYDLKLHNRYKDIYLGKIEPESDLQRSVAIWSHIGWPYFNSFSSGKDIKNSYHHFKGFFDRIKYTSFLDIPTEEVIRKKASEFTFHYMYKEKLTDEFIGTITSVTTDFILQFNPKKSSDITYPKTWIQLKSINNNYYLVNYKPTETQGLLF